MDHEGETLEQSEISTESQNGATETPSDKDNLFEENFGVQPGVERHGEVAIRASEEANWELRDSDETGYIAMLHGHFAVFNRWTEIDSMWEGRFLERIAPGAFTKTFKENRERMRCCFQHGRDPQIGLKPLGPIRELEEDEVGARYDVPLLDTSYNRDLVPGLRGGLYGASFRFQVMREEVDREPKKSKDNPLGLEQRTVTEARVREFGPVTFGAYAEATSGIRSMNDELWDLEMAHSADPVRFAAFLSKLRGEQPATRSPSTEEGEGERPPSPPTKTSAPPPRAPGRSRRRSTRLSGAARSSLRTSKTIREEPKWKIK